MLVTALPSESARYLFLFPPPAGTWAPDLTFWAWRLSLRKRAPRYGTGRSFGPARDPAGRRRRLTDRPMTSNESRLSDDGSVFRRRKQTAPASVSCRAGIAFRWRVGWDPVRPRFCRGCWRGIGFLGDPLRARCRFSAWPPRKKAIPTTWRRRFWAACARREFLADRGCRTRAVSETR